MSTHGPLSCQHHPTQAVRSERIVGLEPRGPLDPPGRSLLRRRTLRPADRLPLAHPLQLPTQAHRKRTVQPRRLRTPTPTDVSYTRRCRMIDTNACPLPRGKARRANRVCAARPVLPAAHRWRVGAHAAQGRKGAHRRRPAAAGSSPVRSAQDPGTNKSERWLATPGRSGTSVCPSPWVLHGSRGTIGLVPS
jgi:hypothetical protein